MRYLSLVPALVLSRLLIFGYAQNEALHTAERSSDNLAAGRKHIHHHHHHRHRKGHHVKHHGHKAHKNSTKNSTKNATNNSTNNSTNNTTTMANAVSEGKIVDKMHKLEQELKAKVENMENPKTEKIAVAPTDHMAPQTGKLEVNAPLPAGFEEMFARAASEATGVSPKEVKLISTFPVVKAHGKVAVVKFTAPGDVVKALLAQASDPESKLAMGPMCTYLVARDDEGSVNEQCGGGVAALATKSAKVGKQLVDSSEHEEPKKSKEAEESDTPDKKEAEESDTPEKKEAEESDKPDKKEAEEPVKDTGIDIDTAMPYGQLEPFGREDTAQELTESSIKESDGMVDQLERAEVAEEKRAIFRALTRLRGAAITSFDGIARSQTGNIDQYTKTNKWRETHPLRHLAQEESDISKWAFPDANL